jgi:plasmid stability protein
MKTTLDLPDELMRAVKIRAVHEHKKLKEIIAELLSKSLGTEKERRPRTPKPIKLKGGPITTDEIERAINWGRD